MIHEASLLAKKQAKRLKESTVRLFSLTGSNLYQDTSVTDRMYQLYAFLLVSVACVLLWQMTLVYIESIFFSMTPSVSVFVLRIVVSMLVLLLCALSLKSVRTGPFFYSPADIAYLVTSSISLGFVFLSGFIADVMKALIVGGLLGFLVGTACVASGANLVATLVMISISIMCAVSVGFSWVIGSLRVINKRTTRRHFQSSGLLFENPLVSGLVKTCILITCVGIVLLIWRSPDFLMSQLFNSLLLCVIGGFLCVLEATLVLVLGTRANASAIAQESSIMVGVKYDALTAMSLAASFGGDFIKEEKRRRNLMRRKPILELPKIENRMTILARSALSVVRQREGWALLAAAGGIISPFGAYILAINPVPLFILAWLFILQNSARSIREIARPFADDMKLRIVRDKLPFNTFSLFLLNTIPGLTVSFVVQIIALSAIFVFSQDSIILELFGNMISSFGNMTDLGSVVFLSPLILFGIAVCCVFDFVNIPYGRQRKIGYEWAAFLFGGVSSLVAILDCSFIVLAVVVFVLDGLFVYVVLKWID